MTEKTPEEIARQVSWSVLIFPVGIDHDGNTRTQSQHPGLDVNQAVEIIESVLADLKREIANK